jgi:hypothetical protein
MERVVLQLSERAIFANAAAPLIAIRSIVVFSRRNGGLWVNVAHHQSVLGMDLCSPKKPKRDYQAGQGPGQSSPPRKYGFIHD